MSETRYKVVFQGELAPGAVQAEVEQRLAELFRMEPDKVAALFSGRTAILRKDLSEPDALRFKQSFDRSGALCSIRPMTDAAPGAPPAPPPAAAAPPPAAPAPQPSSSPEFGPPPGPLPGTMECPKCAFVQEVADACQACGVVVTKYLRRRWEESQARSTGERPAAPAATVAAPASPPAAAPGPGPVARPAPVPGPAAGSMTCPKCQQLQPAGETCSACGVVIAKYLRRQQELSAAAATPEPEHPGPDATAEPRANAGADGRLAPVADLLARSFAHFRRKLGPLIGLWLLGLLLALIAALLYGALSRQLLAWSGGSPLVGLVLGLAALVLACVAFGALAGATIHAVMDDLLPIRAALGLGLQRALAFAWVFFLLSFIITGGTLALLAPGLLFLTWFSLAPFVLADEGLRGMEALLKCRAYVRGYGWGVCGRLLLIMLIVNVLSVLLTFIPLLGPFLCLLLVPFTLVCQGELFHELRSLRGAVVYSCGPGDRIRWPLAAAGGYLVVPLLLIALLGPALFQGLLQTGLSRAPLAVSPLPGELRQQAGSAPVDSTVPGAMIYIYALNYEGEILLNGEQVYRLEGERDMNYNYSAPLPLRYGQNVFMVRYTALPEPFATELKIRIYRYDLSSFAEEVYREWEFTDPDATLRLELFVPRP